MEVEDQPGENSESCDDDKSSQSKPGEKSKKEPGSTGRTMKVNPKNVAFQAILRKKNLPSADGDAKPVKKVTLLEPEKKEEREPRVSRSSGTRADSVVFPGFIPC